MSRILQDQLDAIADSRQKVTKYLSLTFVFIGSILILLNFVYPTNFFLPLVLATLIGLFAYLSHQFISRSVGELITIWGFQLIIYYGAYYISSAILLSLSSLVIIASVFLENKKQPHLLFISNIIVTIIFVLTGTLTIQQTIIEPYKISLSNNVQGAIVALVLSYVISIYIQRILIRTIEIQKKQYQELKEMQKIILSQAQQDTLKILAGGISHDFNNILTILTGNLSLIKGDERIPSDIAESLAEIEQASYKARNLASQLLNMAKDDQNLIKEVHNIPELIESTVNFTLKGSNSQAIFDFQDNLWGIRVDPVQLSQVIQNLVLNAIQAMNRGGTIIVRAINRSVDINDPTILAGDYVEVHVIDEGSGIPEEIQEKIFEIYFTTKEGGSGIGLAISKNIIENHDGYLFYKNQEGRGTDFFFVLPAETLPSNEIPQRIQSDQRKYQATVLIYDDNTNVIRSLSRILQSLGLQVYDASDGHSYIQLMEILAEKGIEMNIFILDLLLPGDISGEKMVNIIREKINDPYIVVSSGYSSEFVVSEYKQYKFNNILRKPYNIDDVQDLLDDYQRYKISNE